MKNYKVLVSRSGKWWFIQVPEVGPLAVTQARRLSEVEMMVRDLLGNIDSVETPFSVSISLADEEFTKAKAVVAQARSKADAAELTAARQTREVAQQLVDKGLPVRDVAELLNISASRVSQLTHA